MATAATPAETDADSARSRWAPGLALVLGLGALTPLLGTLALGGLAPDWRFEHLPGHSLIEALGGAVALWVAVLLRLRGGLGARPLPVPFIGAAMVGMGLLDLAHAGLEPGAPAIFLRGCSSLLGGLAFAASALPIPRQFAGVPRAAPFVALAAALSLAAWAIGWPSTLPPSVVDGRFSAFTRTTSLLGGLGFVVGAAGFVRSWLRSPEPAQLLFATQCALFAAASLLFESSVAWDGRWWWWHLVRLAAFGVAAAFAALEQRDTLARLSSANSDLDRVNSDLEGRVHRRTQQLEESAQQLEAALVQREELEAARWEARLQEAQKLESLGVLAGGIAHDFNNLLVGILGNTGLALEDLEPGHPARKAVEQARAAARRSADLTRQMLAYSGRGHFVVEPIDASAVVQEMLGLLEVSIAGRAELRCDLAPDLPAVEADVTQLRQVVMNLITNAADALETNGSIELSTEAVRLAADGAPEGLPAGSYVAIDVLDSGCGMDLATRARMFEPFFSTKETGRGLGLAALQGIVRGHKGAIEVESELGSGTRIRVLLPALDAAAPKHRPPEHSIVMRRLEGCVLVVDDQAIVRDLASRALKRAGIAVLEADDGDTALDVYVDRGRGIDLIVLDVTMKRMGGEACLAELLQLDSGCRVLMMSGYAAGELRARLGEDVVGFLQKPFSAAELVRRVHEILGSDR